MSDSSSTMNPEEEILIAFQKEYEAHRDPSVVERYCAAHPGLAGEIRARAALIDKLPRVEPETGPALPERLGCFRVLRPLGGHMAQLYLASDDCLGRLVAVKVIDVGRASTEARRRFARERRVLALLRHHTHIVPIHAAGEEGPLHFFAMPYIDGAALHYAVRAAVSLPVASRGPTPSLAALAGLAADSEDRPTTAPDDTGPPPDDAPAPPPGRPALSLNYFDSVARAIADVAEALHHAHALGIVHRDVKPGNLMVDRGGHCHVIDFGLAGFFGVCAEAAAAAAEPDENSGPVTAAGMPGTPPYMAPEQWARVGNDEAWSPEQLARVERWWKAEVGAAADIWGLGVTLYELLSLRPAFAGASWPEVRARVFWDTPPSPRTLVAGVPKDLEAVCRRAMQKEPERRYGTAADMAADLRRWLNHEPTVARGAGPHRRVALWAKRNKGWAAALPLAALALALAVALALRGAEAREAVAQLRADEAESQQRRHMLLQTIQSMRLTEPRRAGWRDLVLKLVREAPPVWRDDDLRDQAATTLAGLDAHEGWRIPGAASHLAFDIPGNRLLAGGLNNSAGQPILAARVLEPATGKVLIASQRAGAGPVAFRDGTPLQLVLPAKGGGPVLLWDIDGQREVGRFPLPGAPGTRLQAAALSADGSRVAIAAAPPGAKPQGRIGVWDTATGKRVGEELRGTVTVLASSPDGTLLAAGNQDGAITVWSPGTAAPPLTLRRDRLPIQAVVFGRDPRQRAGKEGPVNWLLAEGAAGGAVTVWDVAAGIPRSYCHGASYDLHELRFSPDGVFLASNEVQETRLWDTGTGRCLLVLGAPGRALRGLAFTPAGDGLLIGQREAPDGDGELGFWALENGRGLRLLYGLAGQIAKVRISADGTRLAALTHDWQAAVWELESGRLRSVFDAPYGVFADNAALALDAGGRHFAVTAGREAKMWDTVTGKLLGQWELPEGFVGKMTIAAPDRLLLFRVETDDPNVPPFGLRGRGHPRLCRLRNLLGPDPLKPLVEKTDFNAHVLDAAVAPDGSYFVVEGLGGADGKDRLIRAFDGDTGKERWTVRPGSKNNAAWLLLDPAGQFVGYQNAEHTASVLVEAGTGKESGAIRPPLPISLGPAGDSWVNGDGKSGETLVLSRRDDENLSGRVLVRFHMRPTPASEFDAAGGRLAWGMADGTVVVCDIDEVRRRLAELSPGW